MPESAQGWATLPEMPPVEDEISFLRRRVQLFVAMIAGLAVVFSVVDAIIEPHLVPRLYPLKAVSLAACAFVWWLLRPPRSRRFLCGAAAGLGTVAVLLTAVSSVAVDSKPWAASLSSILFLHGAASILPWGPWAQALLVLGGTTSAMLPVLVHAWDPSSWFIVGAQGAAGLSILFAWQNERRWAELRRALIALRENLARTRQLVEHVHGVFWLYESDGTPLYVSPSFEKVWPGRPNASREVEAWLDAVHPDDVARVRSWFQRGALGDRVSCEYRLVRSDEGVCWIRDTMFPIAGIEKQRLRVGRLSLDVTAERELERSKRMQDLARRTQAAVEQERRRLAREMHDELGQALTGIRLLLVGAQSSLGADSRTTRASLAECVREVDEAVRSVHGMVDTLRPPVLDDLGLCAALRNEAETFTTRTGIRCDVDVPDTAPELSDEETTTLFRIAQEALTNVARHARARSVLLSLSTVREGDAMELRVFDDGAGITRGQESSGLRGMRERAALVHGALDVRPRPEGGTVVELVLPRMRRSEPRLR